MSMLILASASAARARLLRAAGVTFGVRPAAIEEAAIAASLLGEGTDVEAIAAVLAERKARQVSMWAPQALVLGCDQTLICDGRLVAKARDIGEARSTLKTLRGRAHQLMTAVVLAQDGVAVWRHAESASLWMRRFGDEFLEAYLKTKGSGILDSVGCYRLEGQGAQLFERVEGDFFTILGLPLVPLLAALRERDILPT